MDTLAMSPVRRGQAAGDHGHILKRWWGDPTGPPTSRVGAGLETSRSFVTKGCVREGFSNSPWQPQTYFGISTRRCCYTQRRLKRPLFYFPFHPLETARLLSPT